MKLTVLAVSLALACAFTSAEARPKHPSHHFASHHKMVGLYVTGCSDPVMKPCHHRLINGRPTYGASGHPVLSGRRPRAWCGWWLGRHLGMLDRKLWLARNWAHVGRPAHGPHIGAVVVFPRGKGGHVGIITGKTAQGWVVLSGNDGHAVRERVRSVSNAIAFRWPS